MKSCRIVKREDAVMVWPFKEGRSNLGEDSVPEAQGFQEESMCRWPLSESCTLKQQTDQPWRGTSGKLASRRRQRRTNENEGEGRKTMALGQPGHGRMCWDNKCPRVSMAASSKG